MSQRIQKVASLLQQIVAESLNQELGDLAGFVTVTSVDVAADIKNAEVWVGILADEDEERQRIFAEVEALRGAAQKAVATKMRSKFTPHIEFKLDQTGPHIDRINSLLRDL